MALGAKIGVPLLVVLATTSGCFSTGEGVEPPLSRIYFPTGLALSQNAKRLFVVNSDFDLQFNGGMLQSLDVERLRSLVPNGCRSDADCDAGTFCDPDVDWCVASEGPQANKPCGAFGQKSPADELVAPGLCGYVDPLKPQDGGKPLIVQSVGIGAFATDAVYAARPEAEGGSSADESGRIFIPVRGDATLHWIDVGPGGGLECGQRGNDGDCDDDHRRGDDPEGENTRDLRLAPEPYGIAVGEGGEAVVVTHQTEGAASLFVNRWSSGPTLEFTVGGMPSRPIGIAAVPEPALVQAADISYQPGFLVSFRNAPEVDLLRYYGDEDAQPHRPYISRSAAVSIDTNSLGYDSRGIAVDPSRRQACEAACAAGDTTCLNECAGLPLAVYVANRAPSSLLVGETRPNASATSSDDLPRFFDSVPLPFGPSRVSVGQIIDTEGRLAPRVFVVCFDSRRIGIYNPRAHSMETWVQTGRGPHALALDVDHDFDEQAGESPSHAYAYIGHFTDSYIGVISLDQRDPNYGRTVLTVAKPTAPRASK